ncbi:hypothetical protein GCM10008085_25100 [Winogradskyella epiphytica]|nr:hypothetical protein GCM10008085_25100 [Winogradskyella epiphytica]
MPTKEAVFKFKIVEGKSINYFSGIDISNTDMGYVETINYSSSSNNFIYLVRSII